MATHSAVASASASASPPAGASSSTFTISRLELDRLIDEAVQRKIAALEQRLLSHLASSPAGGCLAVPTRPDISTTSELSGGGVPGSSVEMPTSTSDRRAILIPSHTLAVGAADETSATPTPTAAAEAPSEQTPVPVQAALVPEQAGLSSSSLHTSANNPAGQLAVSRKRSSVSFRGRGGFGDVSALSSSSGGLRGDASLNAPKLGSTTRMRSASAFVPRSPDTALTASPFSSQHQLQPQQQGRRTRSSRLPSIVSEYNPIDIRSCVADEDRPMVHILPEPASHSVSVNNTSNHNNASGKTGMTRGPASGGMLRSRLEGDGSGAASQPTFGNSEKHVVYTALDITYVVLGLIAIALAVSEVHPRSVTLDTDPYMRFKITVQATVQLFSLGWVASRFFLNQLRDEWEIIDDLPGIRAYYMRTWFAYDLLYSVPFEFIFAGWAWEVYGFLQLRHFLRLPRIVSLGSSHNPLLSSRLWFQFFSFCLIMILIAYFLAVSFWGIESAYTFEESMYWAIATITSVGYGDIVPTRPWSRVYVSFAMFFGVLMLSVMTAFATSLTSKGKREEEQDSQKQTMYAMMEHYDIPWELQKEVIATMPALLERTSEEQFKELTSKMPDFVSKKINAYVRIKMLQKVPLLRQIDSHDVLMELSERLHQRFYPAGHVIIEQGGSDRDLFFILRGVVEVIAMATVDGELDPDSAAIVAVLHPGAFFGEVNLLDPGSTRVATVRAVTLCEVLILSQPDFEDIGSRHDCIGTMFEANLQERVTEAKRTAQWVQNANASLLASTLGNPVLQEEQGQQQQPPLPPNTSAGTPTRQ